jgi:hydrogenase maturation protease
MTDRGVADRGPGAKGRTHPGPRPAGDSGGVDGDVAGPVARDGVLVIGVGNDLRGDDGAGRAVVEELARLAVPGLRALWSHQLVPELAEEIAAARLVIFVDAAPGDRPGVEVRRVTVSTPAAGGHQSDPAALLGLAALAGLDVPDAHVVALPAHDFGLGTQLSTPTRAALADAVAEVLRLASERGCSVGDQVDSTGT